MAVSTTSNKVIHNGNAAATVFPYGFPILDASHLAVVYTDPAGAETTLSPSQFSVTGIGSRGGGSVTYTRSGAPIAVGTKLTIVRSVPYTQTTVLSNQGGYYPEVVERRFDEIYMAIQQLAEIVSRTTVSSISDPATEQSNYALIQALQATIGGFDKLTAAGDLLTRDGNGYKRLARGTAGQFLGISGADPVWATPTVDLSTSQATGVLPRNKGGFTPAQMSAALGANVLMNSTSNYFDGPSLTLGAGLWFVWGQNSIFCAPGGLNVASKLWDGTTVVNSAYALTGTDGSVGHGTVVVLQGYILNPVGAVRISCRPGGRTDASMVFNQSGNSKDCTINAIRIS